MQHPALRTDEDFSVIFNCKDTEVGARGGYSHTSTIRVCAAQRGRDFEAPDLELGIPPSEAFSRTGYKKLWITTLSSA